MTRFWNGRTDGRSDLTPRPAFAFGDAGKNINQVKININMLVSDKMLHSLVFYYAAPISGC